MARPHRVAGVIVAPALAVASGASAESFHAEAIDPGTHVNGMIVVQGIAKEADVQLFTPFCDPSVVQPGTVTRTCTHHCRRGQSASSSDTACGLCPRKRSTQPGTSAHGHCGSMGNPSTWKDLGRATDGSLAFPQRTVAQCFFASGRSSSWGPRGATQSDIAHGSLVGCTRRPGSSPC